MNRDLPRPTSTDAGSPSGALRELRSRQAVAQRTGALISETESALERLESEGRVCRDGDRLVVVETGGVAGAA